MERCFPSLASSYNMNMKRGLNQFIVVFGYCFIATEKRIIHLYGYGIFETSKRNGIILFHSYSFSVLCIMMYVFCTLPTRCFSCLCELWIRSIKILLSTKYTIKTQTHCEYLETVSVRIEHYNRLLLKFFFCIRSDLLFPVWDRIFCFVYISETLHQSSSFLKRFGSLSEGVLLKTPALKVKVFQLIDGSWKWKFCDTQNRFVEVNLKFWPAF